MNVGKDFMENSKHKNTGISDQEKKMPYPPIEKPYDNEGIINLTKPDGSEEEDINLLNLITERTSVRSYDDKPITQDELSYFLWCTQGIKKNIKDKATLRTVPSAGARHAFETYLSYK